MPSVKYFEAQIEKLINNGLLERNGSNVKLTAVGLDLANIVFAEFI